MSGVAHFTGVSMKRKRRCAKRAPPAARLASTANRTAHRYKETPLPPRRFHGVTCSVSDAQRRDTHAHRWTRRLARHIMVGQFGTEGLLKNPWWQGLPCPKPARSPAKNPIWPRHGGARPAVAHFFNGPTDTNVLKNAEIRARLPVSMGSRAPARRRPQPRAPRRTLHKDICRPKTKSPGSHASRGYRGENANHTLQPPPARGTDEGIVRQVFWLPGGNRQAFPLMAVALPRHPGYSDGVAPDFHRLPCQAPRGA